MDCCTWTARQNFRWTRWRAPRAARSAVVRRVRKRSGRRSSAQPLPRINSSGTRAPTLCGSCPFAWKVNIKASRGATGAPTISVGVSEEPTRLFEAAEAEALLPELDRLLATAQELLAGWEQARGHMAQT